MNRDGPDNAPGDSPLRRMKAKQLMNFRKQQRKLDKSIFDKIIVQQNHVKPLNFSPLKVIAYTARTRYS